MPGVPGVGVPEQTECYGYNRYSNNHNLTLGLRMRKRGNTIVCV